MKRNLCFFLFLIVAVPLSGRTQQSRNDVALTETQKLGRLTFMQRCAVCHTIPTPTSRRYGPQLYKDIVEGNEDVIRERILNGSPSRMPGFKYTLDQSHVDAIIDYLKTVERAPR